MSDQFYSRQAYSRDPNFSRDQRPQYGQARPYPDYPPQPFERPQPTGRGQGKRPIVPGSRGHSQPRRPRNFDAFMPHEMIPEQSRGRGSRAVRSPPFREYPPDINTNADTIAPPPPQGHSQDVRTFQQQQQQPVNRSYGSRGRRPSYNRNGVPPYHEYPPPERPASPPPHVQSRDAEASIFSEERRAPIFFHTDPGGFPGRRGGRGGRGNRGSRGSRGGRGGSRGGGRGGRGRERRRSPPAPQYGRGRPVYDSDSDGSEPYDPRRRSPSPESGHENIGRGRGRGRSLAPRGGRGDWSDRGRDRGRGRGRGRGSGRAPRNQGRNADRNRRRTPSFSPSPSPRYSEPDEIPGRRQQKPDKPMHPRAGRRQQQGERKDTGSSTPERRPVAKKNPRKTQDARRGQRQQQQQRPLDFNRTEHKNEPARRSPPPKKSKKAKSKQRNRGSNQQYREEPERSPSPPQPRRRQQQQPVQRAPKKRKTKKPAAEGRMGKKQTEEGEPKEQQHLPPKRKQKNKRNESPNQKPRTRQVAPQRTRMMYRRVDGSDVQVAQDVVSSPTPPNYALPTESLPPRKRRQPRKGKPKQQRDRPRYRLKDETATDEPVVTPPKRTKRRKSPKKTRSSKKTEPVTRRVLSQVWVASEEVEKYKERQTVFNFLLQQFRRSKKGVPEHIVIEKFGEETLLKLRFGNLSELCWVRLDIYGHRSYCPSSNWQPTPKRRVRLGINGFDRTAQMMIRLSTQMSSVAIVAINDSRYSAEFMAHQLRLDSNQGSCSMSVAGCDDEKGSGSYIVVNGTRIEVFSHREVGNVDWQLAQVDYIVDCTRSIQLRGKNSLLSKLFKGGVTRACIVGNNYNLATFVYGVNERQFKMTSNQMFATPEPAAVCVAPLIRILNSIFGIKQAMLNVVGCVDELSKTVDAPNAKNWRVGRGCSQNIIPYSCSTAGEIERVVPRLGGKLGSLTTRVPVPDVCAVDLCVQFSESVTYDGIMHVLREEIGKRRDCLIRLTDENIVSSDVIGDKASIVIDIKSGIQVAPDYIKLIGWFDAPVASAQRLLDLCVHVGRVDKIC